MSIQSASLSSKPTTLKLASFKSTTRDARIRESKLTASVTKDKHEIRRAQILRARVFNVGSSKTDGPLNTTNSITAQPDEMTVDKDQFDDICLHLVVKDSLTNNIVGYSRILTSDLISTTDGFYSASEFDIHRIIKPNQRYMEIGRTCVDPNYRSGAVIALIWAKIGQFIKQNKIDYLMGCASISMRDGGASAIAVVNYLRENHFTDEDLRVTPNNPLPQFDINIDGKKHLPALLKTYLRMGAKVCGEAFIDRDFNVADVVVLLETKDIKPRYLRHFC